MTEIEVGWVSDFFFSFVPAGPIIRDNLVLHWTILCLLQCPETLLLTMNRLKRLAAVLLNPAEDPEQMHAALEAAGVPVSFADCRNCPNPCEDGKTLSSISLDALTRLHRT